MFFGKLFAQITRRKIGEQNIGEKSQALLPLGPPDSGALIYVTDDVPDLSKV